MTKTYYLEHRDEILARLKTPEVRKARNEYQRTPERREWYRNYLKKKRRTDPIFKLRQSIKDRLRYDGKNVTKEKGLRAEAIIGSPLNEAWEYLKMTIPQGMTELDYLNGTLEVDHIIPVLCYTYLSVDDSEFKKCWHYRNMRLALRSENKDRGKGIDWSLVKQYNISDLLPENPIDTFNKIYETIPNNICRPTLADRQDKTKG